MIDEISRYLTSFNKRKIVKIIIDGCLQGWVGWGFSKNSDRLEKEYDHSRKEEIEYWKWKYAIKIWMIG